MKEKNKKMKQFLHWEDVKPNFQKLEAKEGTYGYTANAETLEDIYTYTTGRKGNKIIASKETQKAPIAFSTNNDENMFVAGNRKYAIFPKNKRQFKTAVKAWYNDELKYNTFGGTINNFIVLYNENTPMPDQHVYLINGVLTFNAPEANDSMLYHIAHQEPKAVLDAYKVSDLNVEQWHIAAQYLAAMGLLRMYETFMHGTFNAYMEILLNTKTEIFE